jgi:serine/threonine protein phosphatase PrpC
VSELKLDYACRSEAGDKPENADAAALRLPEGEAVLTKGAAAAVADGMSTAEGGAAASRIAVESFLDDYFATPDSWTVKTSGAKVLGALNRWLYAQGQSLHGVPKAMVTTFTGLVIKSATAHVFHVGDSRLYRWRAGELELLTRDHRVWLSRDREFLSRALGVEPHVDIDYRSLPAQAGDLYLFVTDGVSGRLTDPRIAEILRARGASLRACADALVEEALKAGSGDNVTCLLVRVEGLPDPRSEEELLLRLNELPFPPPLDPGMKIDGYEILRALHASKRSEVYLARDPEDGERVILKVPSINYRDDAAYLEAFLHEEWVGRRIRNPHVVRVFEAPRRRFLYQVVEYVEGQTLRQWIDDHPQTHINKAREFLQQIAEGLRAFHRLEMLHLDLKPDNVMIDPGGLLKIIDLGSVRVAGTAEIAASFDAGAPQGTADYMAPEVLQGVYTKQADIYSLGVMAYELLTGHLPYGESDHPGARRRWRYRSARQYNPNLAVWVDGALHRAVHPDPRKRYDTLSEFLYDLSHPNPRYVERELRPLAERNPVAFWKGVAAVLGAANLALVYLWVVC